MFTLLIVIMSAVMVLSACTSNNGGAENAADGAGSNAADSNGLSDADARVDSGTGVKPVTFTQYVNYDWFTAPTWIERPHAAWMTENLGVEVVPVQSNGAAAQKLNSMIVANELPDAIVLDRGKDVERLVEAGRLVALDPYLEKYPEFVETIGAETLNMLRSADGKLYQIPNWFISGDNGNGNAAYLVNKKIYKELGSPTLETWSDLEAYLQRVKAEHPDVVPLDFGEIRDGSELQMLGMLYSGAANGATPAFLSPSGVFGIPNGNELTSIYKDPAFKDAATFASRLFRSGLTSQDVFTQTRDQILEKLKNGKVAVFGAYDAVVEGIGREANNLLQAEDPEAGYDVIWPFHKEGVDKNQVFPSGYNTLGWNVNVITTNAEDPEAIFSFMNWAISEEGQRIFFFGPPGLFYDEVVGGVPVPNEAYINRDPKAYDEMKIGEFNWYGHTSYVDTTKAKREEYLPEEAQDWTTIAQSEVSFKTSRNMTEFSNLDPLPNSNEGIIMQRLKDHYKQAIPKIIFSKSDEEVAQQIEEAAREADRLGYQEILDWKTAKWQQNLELMGQK
ncbi:extracellular solute-binding protein [Xylanibacillus composti]|nr:extracellular solute-binding protein [Xylanibacillus composti]